MVTTRKRKSQSEATQSAKRKRVVDPKVRENLIHSRNHIIENRAQIVQSRNNEFIETLNKIDTTAKRVNNASDATLVVEQTDMMSSILQEQTRKCDANTAKVSIDDLIDVIKDEYMDDGMPDLNKLFELVHPNYNGVPPVFCFNNVGGMEYVQKPKKKRKIQKKPELIVPDTMKKASEKAKETEEETTDTANRVQGLVEFLTAQQKADGTEHKYRLLQTLMNPESFSETLENIYDFSHATSQGNVKIFMSGGKPVYQFLGREGPKVARQSRNRQQFCLSFDGGMHSELSQHMTQSQIPTRSQIEE